MKASEFLRIVFFIAIFVTFLLLGVALFSYLFGWYDLPLGDWTMGMIMQLFFWLFLIIYMVLIILAALLVWITSSVKKRDQKQTIPNY